MSHRSITAVTAVLLALFTVGAALVSRSATATETKAGPYALRIDVARAGKKLNIRATITENTTGAVVARPSVIAARNETFRSGAKTDDVEFEIAGTTDQSNRVSGTFVVRQGSSELQRLNFKATVADQPAAAPNYSGEPITLNLKDADLRDVLKTFGRITGMEIRAEDGVAGKVTVSWVNVPLATCPRNRSRSNMRASPARFPLPRNISSARVAKKPRQSLLPEWLRPAPASSNASLIAIGRTVTPGRPNCE